MLRTLNIIIGLSAIGFAAFLSSIPDARIDTVEWMLIGALALSGLAVTRYALTSRPVDDGGLISAWLDYKKADLRKRKREIDRS